MIVYAIIFKNSRFDSCGITQLYFAFLAKVMFRTSITARFTPSLIFFIILLATIGCASVVLEPITIINSVFLISEKGFVAAPSPMIERMPFNVGA